MTRRTSARGVIDREVAGCIDFDCALQDYLERGEAEDLLCAAALVLGCRIPLGPKHAKAIAELTGTDCELVDYDDAGRAVRRWFAMMEEGGARH
jgi:hypothetical protein